MELKKNIFVYWGLKGGYTYLKIY